MMDIQHTSYLAARDRKPLNVVLLDDDPVLLLRGDGKILHTTPSARMLLAYTSEAINQLVFFSLVHQLHLYQIMRDVSNMVLHGKEQASWVIPLKTAGGHWRWFNIFVRNRLEGDAATLHLTLEEV